VVDIGAGTGKGTEVLLGLGANVTAIEPDARMAAVLRARFPSVDVQVTTFEEWAAPPGGVAVLGCALAWHWMDAGTRNRRAFDALAPGGVLAVFGHAYGYRYAEQSAALDEAFNRANPDVPARDEHWIVDDLRRAGVWPSIEELEWHTDLPLTTERYLALTQTFSPFRRHSPEVQRRLLGDLAAAIDGFGGTVTLDLHTTLVVATK
jgi:SAM-dependent methyltransferase